jgi:hypothetical protein
MYFEIAELTASIWLLLAWGVLVGLVFSTVGAAGGILASVGLISVFGLQNPNMVKPMAQAITLVTPLIAVPLYMQQCRVVYRLALLLGAGGIVGALIGSELSVHFLSDINQFKLVFAILIFVIASQMGWSLLQRKTESEALTKTMRAAETFEQQAQSDKNLCDVGVKCIYMSLKRVVIQFGKEEFSFNPWLPFLTGMIIAIFSSALGVGGGFLLVPFMSLIMRFPMHVIAGTSALAILVHLITSITNYIRLGIELDYELLGILLVGVMTGSAIGPFISRFIPEKGLRTLLCGVLFLIGLRYTGLF